MVFIIIKYENKKKMTQSTIKINNLYIYYIAVFKILLKHASWDWNKEFFTKITMAN